MSFNLPKTDKKRVVIVGGGFGGLKLANKLRNSAEYALSKFPGYTTELKFHPTRKWRFDYAWEGQKIAVEVHGGVYRQGRHTRGEGFTTDREKMNEAALLGWTVIEVTPEHIKSGQLAKWLTRAFQSRGATGC